MIMFQDGTDSKSVTFKVFGWLGSLALGAAEGEGRVWKMGFHPPLPQGVGIHSHNPTGCSPPFCSPPPPPRSILMHDESGEGRGAVRGIRCYPRKHCVPKV